MAMLIHLYRTQANNTKAVILAQTIHPLCLALLRIGANPAPMKALMEGQGFSVGGTRLPITVLGNPKLQELMSLFEKVRSQLIENDLWTEPPLS
jgi:dihydrodipicolinate synthase/N-acetylneuraminate lyase